MLSIRTQEDIDNPPMRVYLFRIPIYEPYKGSRVLMEMVFHNLPENMQEVWKLYQNRVERVNSERTLHPFETSMNTQVLETLEALASYVDVDDWPEEYNFVYQTEKTFKFPHPVLGWESATLQEMIPIDAI
jgi:hypothetical protein